MTETVFITGDRMMTPLYPGQVAVEMLRALAHGKNIATGDQLGIEEVVRVIGKLSEVEVEVVNSPIMDVPEQWVDWDTRHKALLERDGLEFVAIHVDPLSCTGVKSVLMTVPEDRLRLVSLEDFLITSPE